MHDSNRFSKWALVVILVILAGLSLYPPSRTLKGGIDLVGGTSLLLEIDTTGLERGQQTGLASKVMNVLKDRVDPKGQLNLEWRPVGNTRLEIRMPQPPKEALARRDAKDAALDAISARNLKRFDVEEALSKADAERKLALASLVGATVERASLADALMAAFDKKRSADTADDDEAKTKAADAYEAAMAALLATNAPVGRISDILALGEGARRDKELDRFRNEFPAFDAGSISDSDGKLITKAMEAYDEWAKDKADLEDPSDLKRRIKGAGVLEFRILAERDPSSPTNILDPQGQGDLSIKSFRAALAKQGPRMRQGDRIGWFAIENPLKFFRDVSNFDDVDRLKDSPGLPVIEDYAGRYYVLAYNAPQQRMLKGTKERKWKLRSAFGDRDPMTGENVVSFVLDARGGRLFGELTGANVQRELCILLDNRAVSYANIRERITERCQISGRFSADRVQDLVRTLDAGSLPARIKEQPLMEKTIGPSLGETNRTMGINAAIYAAVAVSVFVLLYYGIAAGGMANVALAMNLLFVLAAMALLQATFTLPGIAGLILTVGMAIDANVLIFERIREERKRGVVFKKALNSGYDKAFSTIMDANLTTLLTCIILGFVGSEEVKGFAITLGIGIVTSLFTSLFITRLVFNTMISSGMLKDFSMRAFIGSPNMDWLSLRSKFWPFSVVTVILGAGVFVLMANTNKEAVFDIEFLGGTGIQVDLKPGVALTDEDVSDLISADHVGGKTSAADWLESAAERLDMSRVEVSAGSSSRMLLVKSVDNSLTGEELSVLLAGALDGKIEADGTTIVDKHAVEFEGKPGALTQESLKAAIVAAQDLVSGAATRLRSARVQSVADLNADPNAGLSYEVVTIETNRQLVQAAILAAMGDELEVQRSIQMTVANDDELLNEPYFVVESEDQYISDVLGGGASFDIRRFRGGVAVDVQIDENEHPVQVAELSRRLREYRLSVNEDNARARETAVFPLGAGSAGQGYRRFAFLAVDDTTHYDEVGESLWKDSIARPFQADVEGAMAAEKSLSKVVQFAPQVAGQAKNRAVFSIILALGAIVVYLSLRFGTKEYGLAAIVALVHDVSITLGLVTLSRFVAGTFIGDMLLIKDAFRVDLPMIAAILTVIGYSLNDTIVVFDRIRENRGKIGKLQASTINNSINQTLSRTLLTSITTFIAVGVLYAFGGAGVHGFSFALMIGVIVGTYSSIGIATPLLYRPAILWKIMAVLVAVGMIGLTYLVTDSQTMRLVGTAILLAGLMGILMRKGEGSASRSGRPAAV